MKKILLTLILLASMPVFAQHHHGYWSYRSGPNPWVWVAPTIIGGVIGYEIAKQPPVIVQQQPVIVQQHPQFNCSPWTEIQNPDGTITRTRTCSQ